MQAAAIWRPLPGREYDSQRSNDDMVEIGVRRAEAGEDLRQIVVWQSQMASNYRHQHVAVIGGHGEIAALEQRVRRKTRPLAINSPAAYAAAQHPDDIAVAVIGAAVAILLHGAAEFGEHDDDRIVPVASERLGKGGEPVAERAQPFGELTFVVALADMRVPAAEAQKGETDIAAATDRSGKPFRRPGQPGSWRGTILSGHSPDGKAEEHT